MDGWMDLGSVCVWSVPMRSSEDGIGLPYSLAAGPVPGVAVFFAFDAPLLLAPESNRR